MASPWPPAHPLLCLVTDRQGLAAWLGRHAEPSAALRRQVAAAVEAGVDLVHVRERDLEAGALVDLVAACVETATGSATKIVVNDRLDVALAARADGVHLRGDSFSPALVRPVVPPGFLIGLSVRSAAEAQRASEVDYLVLGTVFPTPSKPNLERVVGVDELTKAARAAAAPVLAIGGVTEERLAAVARAGARGIAAIRLFFCAADDGRSLRARVAGWRRVFDTNGVIS